MSSNSSAATSVYDVLIMGGGLAGLTLAIQLRTALGLRVLVLEQRHFPAPEAAFKVGESVAEIGAWYLSESLSLSDYLGEAHIRKQGLRFFMSNEDNNEIEGRLEVGPRSFLFTKSYQLDRGRLENELARRARAGGVKILDGAKVLRWQMDSSSHVVSVRFDSGEISFRARWVIDASGRRGIIRKQLALTTETGHNCHAVWWRIEDEIRIDDFPRINVTSGGDDGTALRNWSRRVPSGERWRSTNHLAGEGYWVWLIPLSSGATSVGIVADPRCVPWERINTFQKAMLWLGEHEPQLASEVRSRRSVLMDFHRLRRLAYGSSRVFSGDRWALTGEAGVFLDPLYSPGTDFIALANHFIVDLIRLDLHEDPEFNDRIERANHAFLKHFSRALPTWLDMYPLMGNGPIFAVKVVWDTIVYFAFLALSFVSGGSYDLDFLTETAPLWQQLGELNEHFQGLLRRAHHDSLSAGVTGGFVDLSSDFLRDLNGWLAAPLPRPELVERLGYGLEFLRGFFKDVERRLVTPNSEVRVAELGLEEESNLEERFSPSSLFAG